MKLKLLLLPLLVFSMQAAAQIFGQGYLILKDNQKIKYDKFKVRKKNLVVTVTNENKKRKIDPAQVIGYYHANDKIFFYKKNVASDQSTDYNFLQKELCGKINLYTKIEIVNVRTASTSTTPGMPGTNTSNYFSYEKTHYYLEKADKFDQVFESKTLGKKKYIEILKSYVSDNQEILNKIDKDFTLKPKKLISLIKAYNLATYEKKSTRDTSSMATVIIYRYNRGDASEREKATIRVGDSTYLLSTKSFCKIKVDTNQNTKICFGQGNESCEIIDGSPYFTQYYELNFKSDGDYTFEIKPKPEADRFLKGIYYYDKRKKNDD